MNPVTHDATSNARPSLQSPLDSAQLTFCTRRLEIASSEQASVDELLRTIVDFHCSTIKVLTKRAQDAFR